MKPAHGTVVTQASLHPDLGVNRCEVYCSLCDDWMPYDGDPSGAPEALERHRRRKCAETRRARAS